jgi:hypothetical protein
MTKRKQIIILLLIFFGFSCHQKDLSNLHIALVAPLTGESSSCGKAYLNGVNSITIYVLSQGHLETDKDESITKTEEGIRTKSIFCQIKMSQESSWNKMMSLTVSNRMNIMVYFKRLWC